MASGLALRNVLRRTKQTAVIARAAGRDAAREPADDEPARHPRRDHHARAGRRLRSRSRWWTCSRTTSAARSTASTWSSTTIPSSPATRAVYKDIRADYGSTSTILTEHLRAVDVNISERTATAMLYAIKSDTLFFNRQANRVDIEAFSYLYPLADAALIRKMEGAEITMERLEYVLKAKQHGRMDEQVFCAFLGNVAARGLHPLRRRLLPAAREREVDDRRRDRQRLAGHVGAEPRLLDATPASSCASTSPTSAAPAAIARWPRPSCRCAPSATSSATCRPTSSPTGCSALALEFLHEHQTDKLVKA